MRGVFSRGYPMELPRRISGRSLQALTRFSRTRAGASLLYAFCRGEMRLGELDRIPASLLGDLVIDNRPLAGRAPREAPTAGLPLPPAPWSGTSATLTAAYKAGATTPTQVVEGAFVRARALAARRPSCGPILDAREDGARAEAAASTARWQTGRALGVFDGVPMLVKEQTAVAGLPARGGSDLGDAAPAAHDATCVARLRAAGAIVLGTTMMTEYGMTPLGFNPKRVMPRNPHATGHVAGGSSTGSGVAVATGVVPFAAGGDGGGSIRIPAGLCGVFGIKPTWGRVSRSGDIFGGTVGHLGPIASSTLDLAHFLENRERLRSRGFTDGARSGPRRRFVRGCPRARRPWLEDWNRRLRVGRRLGRRRQRRTRCAPDPRKRGRHPGRRPSRAHATRRGRRLSHDQPRGPGIAGGSVRGLRAVQCQSRDLPRDPRAGAPPPSSCTRSASGARCDESSRTSSATSTFSLSRRRRRPLRP